MKKKIIFFSILLSYIPVQSAIKDSLQELKDSLVSLQKNLVALNKSLSLLHNKIGAGTDTTSSAQPDITLDDDLNKFITEIDFKEWSQEILLHDQIKLIPPGAKKDSPNYLLLKKNKISLFNDTIITCELFIDGQQCKSYKVKTITFKIASNDSYQIDKFKNYLIFRDIIQLLYTEVKAEDILASFFNQFDIPLFGPPITDLRDTILTTFLVHEYTQTISNHSTKEFCVTLKNSDDILLIITQQLSLQDGSKKYSLTISNSTISHTYTIKKEEYSTSCTIEKEGRSTSFTDKNEQITSAALLNILKKLTYDSQALLQHFQSSYNSRIFTNKLWQAEGAINTIINAQYLIKKIRLTPKDAASELASACFLSYSIDFFSKKEPIFSIDLSINGQTLTFTCNKTDKITGPTNEIYIDQFKTILTKVYFTDSSSAIWENFLDYKIIYYTESYFKFLKKWNLSPQTNTELFGYCIRQTIAWLPTQDFGFDLSKPQNCILIKHEFGFNGRSVFIIEFYTTALQKTYTIESEFLDHINETKVTDKEFRAAVLEYFPPEKKVIELETDADKYISNDLD